MAMFIRCFLARAFGIALSATVCVPAAAALPDTGTNTKIVDDDECVTVESIARTNRGIIEEEFRLADEQARMFLAADPAMLDFPEDFDRLTRSPIDETVVWRHKRRKTIGMAVPFSAGCAVQGYGEPDLFEKLEAMRHLVLLISDRGPDSLEVQSTLRNLATFRERTATGQVISTPSEVEERVDSLLARILSAQVGLKTSTINKAPDTPLGCTFDDLNVSVDIPPGFSPIDTDCPTVGYRKLLTKMQALGFYVQRVQMREGFSLDYGDVKEFVEGQVLVTQVQFDKSYGNQLLRSRRIDEDSDYPKAIIDRHGACGQLEVEFPQTVSGHEGVERRRGLICVAEIPPSGSKKWFIINIFVFEMNSDPGRNEPSPEFEQIFREVARSVRFNQPKS